MYDPNYQSPAMQQAAFQFGTADPMSYLARIKALQQGQNPQNDWSAATGTTGTDLAKIMQLLKQKKMLDSLQGNIPGVNSPSELDYNWAANAQGGA